MIRTFLNQSKPTMSSDVAWRNKDTLRSLATGFLRTSYFNLEGMKTFNAVSRNTAYLYFYSEKKWKLHIFDIFLHISIILHIFAYFLRLHIFEIFFAYLHIFAIWESLYLRSNLYFTKLCFVILTTCAFLLNLFLENLECGKNRVYYKYYSKTHRFSPRYHYR